MSVRGALGIIIDAILFNLMYDWIYAAIYFIGRSKLYDNDLSFEKLGYANSIELLIWDIYEMVFFLTWLIIINVIEVQWYQIKPYYDRSIEGF